MRKFLTQKSSVSPLTARLSSPFLRSPVQPDNRQGTTFSRTRHESAGRAEGGAMTNRDFADAAIRYSRTLW